MNKKYIIKKALERAGVNISSSDLDRYIKEYNKYEMPIGKRTSRIIQDKNEFKAFYDYVHFYMVNPDRKTIGFWTKLRYWFKNKFKR